GVVGAERQGGGPAKPGGRDVDELPVEIEMDEPAVLAIADEEERLARAVVDGEPVAGLDLAVLLARARQALHVLALGVEFVDERGAVAVGDEERAVGRGDDGRRVVVVRGLVRARFHGNAEGPDGRAVEAELESLVSREVSRVEELLALLLDEEERVATRVLLRDGLLELA